MTTLYQVCRCTVGWYEPKWVDYAKPHLKTVHRSLRAAVKALSAEQRRCRRDNGSTTWLPIKILALREGRNGPYSDLNDQEWLEVSDLTALADEI